MKQNNMDNTTWNNTSRYSNESLTTDSTWNFATVNGQNPYVPYMSDQGGGASAGIIVGAAVGGAALIVGVIAMVIYCYMKARKEQAKPNMTKSTDVFATSASNTNFDFPQRSRVNQYPDGRRSRDRTRENGRDKGHVNPAYARHSSDSSSIGSDVDGRDLSPPRVRHQFSSLSSDDSSSIDEDVIPGNTFRMEKETDRNARSSYKKSRQNNLMDRDDSSDQAERISRRDNFNRIPRSDSPLTIGSLKKHEQITRSDNKYGDNRSSKSKSRKREPSPSSRTYESSEVTQGSYTTEGTMTSSGTSRFQKNPSLRRNSPSRSSSHRRYRKDNEKDSHGRRKPRRTRSRDRGDHTDSARRERSRSPGSSSQRSSSSRGSSQRSRRHAAAEAKQINKEQAMLPIFSQTNKKSSAV